MAKGTKVVKGSAKTVSPKRNTKFVIDCTRPANDAIFDVSAFENFLHDRFKVEGKTGQLGTVVDIKRDDGRIVVVGNEAAYPKRYLKYLTKKFLKKNQLRDWLHVIASDKNTYELRYFNIGQDDEEEAANAEEADEADE